MPNRKATRGELGLLFAIVGIVLAALLAVVIVPRVMGAGQAGGADLAAQGTPEGVSQTSGDAIVQPRASETATTADESKTSPGTQSVYSGETLQADKASGLEKVPLGQTAALVNGNSEASIAYYWDGTLEMTVDSVALYDTLEEAQAVEDLGVVVKTEARALTGDSARLLVIHMTLRNVDATPGLTIEGDRGGSAIDYFYADTFAPSYFLSSGSQWNGVRCAFDGAPEGTTADSPNPNHFYLNQGETRSYTFAWWMDAAIDPADYVLIPATSGQQGTVSFDLGLSGEAE